MRSRTRLMRLKVMLAACLALGSATLPARAHSDEKGPHGGLMVDAKGHHVEMTAQDKELTFFLMDDGHAPVSSKGMSGRIVVLQGSAQTSAPLEPREPNSFVARLEAPLGPGARVVLNAKTADGRNIVARFVSK